MKGISIGLLGVIFCSTSFSDFVEGRVRDHLCGSVNKSTTICLAKTEGSNEQFLHLSSVKSQQYHLITYVDAGVGPIPTNLVAVSVKHENGKADMLSRHTLVMSAQGDDIVGTYLVDGKTVGSESFVLEGQVHTLSTQGK